MLTGIKTSTDQLEPILSGFPDWSSNGIKHGFFTRKGGVSTGIYQGLNAGLGSGDDPNHVLENRRRIAQYLEIPNNGLACPHQIHSADVVIATRPFGDLRPKADAVATRVTGLAVGVLTADCGPVLFADPFSRVVAAAHAGWKGALAGILENTIDAMETLGARRDNIQAVLGPTICQENYEVGPEFVEKIIRNNAASDRFLKPSARPGHAMFDLPGFIMDRLLKAGVHNKNTAWCTYANHEHFYSYRRATHEDEPNYGRQLSAILLGEI